MKENTSLYPISAIFFFLYKNKTSFLFLPPHRKSELCVYLKPTFHTAGDTWQPGSPHSPPSVVIVIVLRDEDVVFLQQRSEVLADLSPDVQEGQHYQSNADKAEGGLLHTHTHTTVRKTLLPCRSRTVTSTQPQRVLNAALTFLGLGRTAPDEVHTAVRPGGPKPGVRRELRGFLRADSPTRRPRADAMLTASDAAAMRKNWS